MKASQLVFKSAVWVVGVTVLFAGLPAIAQPVPGLPPELIISGWLKPPFKSGSVSRGNLQVRELRAAQLEVLDAKTRIVTEAKRVFEQNSAIGLLLIEKDGSILFESYKRGADQHSVMIGYSMSKSATSVAVGQALCDGVFTSLDDAAEKYSETLKGTAYGQATLQELLNLASGGKKGEQAGQAVPGITSDILRHQTRTIRSGFKEFGGGGASAATRGELSYKNYDTYALGVALADASKQPAYAYFSQAVWSRIGAQSDAAWLLDRNGDTSTAEGFGATLRDWGRFALYVRDQAAADNTSCLGNYLRQATSKRVSNNTQILSHFRSYGNGFWADNYLVKSPSFWMTGYAGQRIAVDPASGRVLVLIANVEDFMPEVYRLFDFWTRQ